ncbi:MAG: oxygenase MpaB family protein [Vicinamibacterales bacterium]
MVAQRLNAERLVLLGWTRAILLQLAHPLIAAGVYDHSSFRATPWAAASRLHSTIRAMLALSFGTDAEREHALHGIRTIHTRVNGQLRESVGMFPAGSAYSAEDPALVLWVHLTLLESIPLAYELFVGPVSDRERDSYCAESAWVAIALGARPADVPVTWAHASDQLARMYASDVLAVGSQAHELSIAVLAPRFSRLLPLLASWNRLVAVGLLPAQIRREYRLAWNDIDQRRFERTVLRLRRVRQSLPDVVALWPESRA